MPDRRGQALEKMEPRAGRIRYAGGISPSGFLQHHRVLFPGDHVYRYWGMKKVFDFDDYAVAGRGLPTAIFFAAIGRISFRRATDLVVFTGLIGVVLNQVFSGLYIAGRVRKAGKNILHRRSVRHTLRAGPDGWLPACWPGFGWPRALCGGYGSCAMPGRNPERPKTAGTSRAYTEAGRQCRPASEGHAGIPPAMAFFRYC